MKRLSSFLPVLALWVPLAGAAQDKCAAQAQAEQQRIERELTAQRPARGDKAAEQAWASKLHSELAAVASRFEACTRANTPKHTAAATAKMDDCLAGVRRRGDELRRQSSGRTLSLQEQTLLRDQERRLHDDYMACSRTTPR